MIRLAVLIIAAYLHEILARFSAYQELRRIRPFYVAESIDKIGGAILCFSAVGLMYRLGVRGICRELGLSVPGLLPILLAVGTSLPMSNGFATTRKLTPHVLSPLAEEIEFRGFGVRQAQRGSGRPFWAVVWPSAALFGYGHVEQGTSLPEMAGLFFLTGTGGVVFAWLVHRWQTLWVAVALHMCMNLCWDLFSIAKNVIGDRFPFALQTLTVLLAVLGTLYFTASQKIRIGRENAVE